MRPSKAQFVTSCQQLLALGAVIAVLAPAASVVSLDVVGPQQGSTSAGATRAPGTTGGGLPAAASRVADGPDRAPSRSTVPVGSVEPTVTEVALTTDDGAAAAGDDDTRRPGRPEAAREKARDARAPSRPVVPRASPTAVTSPAEPVQGYGAVGVTWASDAQVAEQDLELQVRTSTAGTWSGWADLEYHDDHAPDVDSAEGQHTRPGTDPLLVGTVDLVQARAVAAHGLPADLSLSVVAPGRPAAVAEEEPELVTEAPAGAAESESDSEDGIELQAAGSTAPQPTIYSRRQWGANERLRSGSPRYGSISAGFVHHTVNGNDYTKAQVPGILRSIYAYHTQSRGWSDIGYNFLVDKFGRIWEGRAGGIARPVVGAHTLGYNEDSFAMSAIGNFETARPTDAMLRAYGSLFAWKLGLHGIDPLDTSQQVNGDTFRAINGHRDAGSTACPGRYLYAQLPRIRTYAAAAGDQTEQIVVRQAGSDLADTSFPDLVVRRASDGRGMILPTGGLTGFRRPSVLGGRWGQRTTLAVPDLTNDGHPDVVTFDRRGTMEIRPRLADGSIAAIDRRARRFRGYQVVATTGDLNRDGRPDFVARRKGRLVVFLGNGRGGFRRAARATSMRGYRQVVGAGDVTGDGRPDLWARDHRGRLFLHRGLRRSRFTDRQRVPGDWAGYDWLVGGGDFTGDAVPDLLARRADGALVLHPSRGNGALGRAQGPVRGRGLSKVSAVQPVAGRRSTDLLATRGDGALVLVRNRGTFDLGRPIDTGRSFSRGNLLLNAGDFTGDGHGDVIMRRRNGSLWLFSGDGTGRLAAPVRITGRRPFRSVTGLRVVADVSGDGRPDLLGRRGGDGMFLWPGNGAAHVQKGTAVDVANSARAVPGRRRYDWLVQVSDLRNRGAADVLARDHAGAVYRLDGRRNGYRTPRSLGEAVGYNLAG